MKKYNHSQELFRDLPDTILLVGNGIMQNKGKLINSYDFVIRFNDFEIDGYDEHVGTQIDAISLHCSDFSHKNKKYLEKNTLISKVWLYSVSI
jgi:hypothetical protein